MNLVNKFKSIGMEIRHLTKEPTINFTLTDSHFMASIERMSEEEGVAGSVLYSNEPAYLVHFGSLFDRLWNESMPAEEVINLIQQEKEIPFIETITSPEITVSQVNELIISANMEILGILPTFESLRRQLEAGIFDHIKRVSQERNLAVRILITDMIDFENEEIKSLFSQSTGSLNLLSKIDEGHERFGTVHDFTMKDITNMTIRSVSSKSIIFEMGLIIIDRCKSMVIEPKENTSRRAVDHIGLASYSNSLQISRSYASIFDTVWNQAGLYKQLESAHERVQAHDNMQREFIDIVAHELRTPLQSMLGLTQYVKDKLKEKESKDLLVAVTESGRKLHNMIENILMATKLEGNFSSIPKETFDLSTIILETVNYHKTRLENIRKSFMPNTKKIEFELKGLDNEYVITANKLQISLVVSNIIDNAINFISERKDGLVSITIDKKEGDVTVHIKDNGDGINPEILPRLFNKFATKSFYGSGLGLYTCRKIIQTHKGKIWAKNNSSGEEGATFSFSIPLVVMQY